MIRVVLLAGTEERPRAVEQAMKLLGHKVLGFNSVEGYLVVRKLEAEAILAALKRYNINAELKTLPS